MRIDRITRVGPLHPVVVSLKLALLTGLAGCEATAGVERLADPINIHLDPTEVARLAEEAAEQVPVQFADGLELRLWAPEPLLIDPIALSVAANGDVYVTGSNRSGIIVDIRWHPAWTTEALSLRTVEELRAFFRRELAPERSAENADWLPDLNDDGSHDWRDLAVQTERLYRVRDTSGDGLADLSQLLLDGLNTEVTDVAGGVLALDGDVYVGAAPDLWHLRDTGGDGVVDVKESISHGYSVHPGIFGHGVSGVTLGPDGRIYWSVGDMGFTVTDRAGRTWSYPNQGAILRAEPDGSGFEVFATGLRNTHEFAFDERGNLISVDNDGDLPPDEVERVVYVVEGSDSGWRVNWQWGKYTDPDNNAYNVWMEEGLFRPRFQGQAAYITPPIASYDDGPSGFVYNPGTALAERWRDHFLVALFTGNPARSSIRAFRLEENGASFELVSDTVLLRGLLTTGMDFGPDGALYLADWVEGWGSTGSGRVWKLDDPDAAASELRAETHAVLAGAWDRRADPELARLLQHPDMRVRLRAQIELAGRSAAQTLHEAASQTAHDLARLHGVWGLGQLARADARHAELLTEFLRDQDAEVRAQAAKTIGDVRYTPAGDALVPLLADEMARVRYFAAEALGRIGHAPAVEPLIAMLETNDDEDAYLRHAGSLALARTGEPERLIALVDHPSRAVRIAAVVALRRMQHPGVARFLVDPDENVVTEAARAINDDESIEVALPELARILEQDRPWDEPILRRVLNANLRLGTAETAERVARFASREGAAEPLRVEAIAMLGVWPAPSPLDRVDGIWRGRVARDPDIARAAAAPLIGPILGGSSAPLKVAFAQTAGRLGLAEAAPALLARVQTDPESAVRVAAIEALHALGAEQTEEAMVSAVADRSSAVRTAGLGLIVKLGLPEESTVGLLASVLTRGSIQEQQVALRTLGTLRGTHAAPVVTELLDRLASGQLAPELELELIETIEAINEPEIGARLAGYRAADSDRSPVAALRETLRGGDAERGREVVFGSGAAQCTRCHVIEGAGSPIGPEITGVGTRLTREALLAALVDPPPAMPSVREVLSRREIRDVIEYLATLK